jgi:hypothetical protein
MGNKRRNGATLKSAQIKHLRADKRFAEAFFNLSGVKLQNFAHAGTDSAVSHYSHVCHAVHPQLLTIAVKTP